VRTRVGYTGGQLKNPKYHHMGDHTETIQLDYDPKKISYERLLELFWNNHDPSSRSSRQYMSAIFVHNKDQEELAKKTKDQQLLKRQRRGIATVIESANEFYVAEDYHQKYLLRKHPELLKHVKYSTNKELVDSTVASKLNGYVGGYRSSAQLEKEIADFALPDYVADKLRKIVATTEPEEC